MRTTSNHMKSLLLLGPILAAIFLTDLAQACGPGRAGGRRLHNRLRKYPPLVQRQYIPNVSENTLGASGRPEGPIKRRDTKRFKELVQNWNPDIEFRDEERTGADRMMSQRLKEKLSVLAISVMNQWPNVRLRVIEGWDEDMRHSPNSLHYEGRAVDITTSDKDKSKYGMLARLAVEAGFDWVHYESRSHVHCSVKSEKADTIRNNGCFDAKSLVETPLGQVEMSQLQTNDLVLAMDSKTGELHFSPIIMWLDRDESGDELYVELTTKSGQLIRLTSSHLIYTADEPPSPSLNPPNQTSETTSVHNDLSREAGKAEPTNDYIRYYYNFTSATYERSAEQPERLQVMGSHRATKIATTSESGNRATSIRQALESSDLRELVYTDYARNVLVGQYVLVSSLDQQIELVAPSQEKRHSGRLTFTPTANSQVSATKSEFEHYKNKKQRRAQVSNSIKMPRVKFDQIVSVNFVNRKGIYAPLTREGNIVVNSVVASCYAVISDHDLAHMSFAPVRWLNILQEHTLGLMPDKPLSERLSETIQRRTELEASVERQALSKIPEYNTTNSLNRTASSDFNKRTRHIHWYPILLYNIARLILPNGYLY